MTDTTQHDTLKVIEAWEELLSKRDWNRFEDILGESVVLRAPVSPEPLKGRKAVREFYEGFTNAFPDLDPNAQRRFAQGEWVFVEYAVTGTHSGPLVGAGQTIPPTHKKITLPNATIYRVQGGKVTEISEYFDQLGFLAQLGLASPPG